MQTNQQSIVAPYEESQVFVIASEKILAKEFDGELTLINLDTGVYFAAGGPAPEIWLALSSGHTINSTAKRLAARYQIAEMDARAHATRIATELVGFGLLVASVGAAQASDGFEASLQTHLWSEPWLESYGDMQDLLLLDPVHDVEGGSWPKAG